MTIWAVHLQKGPNSSTFWIESERVQYARYFMVHAQFTMYLGPFVVDLIIYV